MEAKACEFRVGRPDPFPPIFRADRTCGILDYFDSSARRDLQDCIEFCWKPNLMHKEDRLGAGCDCAFDTSGINVVRRQIDINKYGPCTRIRDGVRRGDE